MICPGCDKISLCGCKSCKKRMKNKIPLLRTYKFVKSGEFAKCPYCREIFHPDALLDKEMEYIKHNIKS